MGLILSNLSRLNLGHPSKLNPGDHIIGNRAGILYSHHGIYVGDGMVIHLMPAEKKGENKSVSLCRNCGYSRDQHSGIIKTCLDCFLDGNILFIFNHPIPCRPPDDVIRIATEFLQGKRDFGAYNVVFNNCEDFASYCKTGVRISYQRSGGF
ncbi:phospholipase A and acyltransferase 4-like [Pistacia vera]|uniref:phospholipase A and acyltransferase 4-like n=1 Tax=Pistacia vera TaxID=55513 RepID=UPI001263521B|nr:phospholipase A and acyltransferase 4-like [Pistacia vera]